MTNVQRSRRQVRLSRALGIALTPKAQRIFIVSIQILQEGIRGIHFL